MAYTIIEVEKKTGIPSRTLRFWLSKELFPYIERDKNGIRYFSENDVKWVIWVNCLRNCNMSIKDIKHYVSLAKGGIQTAKERKELLERQFANLNEQLEILNEAHKKIKTKIALYDEMLETGIDFLNPNDKSKEELAKIAESDLIIYQMPAWWMGEPFIVKKYIDEVYLAGFGVLFANDGRSRADESLKYGSGGLAQGKKVMLSVTWNAPKEAFVESDGFFEGVGVEGVYLHLRKAHEFCGMQWLPIFMCNDVVKNPQIEQYISDYKAHLQKYV